VNKVTTTAEPEKQQPEPGLRTPESDWSQSTLPTRPAPIHGVLSRLRSYLIFDPLIWLYTIVLGCISLLVSLLEKNGRLQHRLATLWSRLIMKTILSPVTVTGNPAALAPPQPGQARVYAVTHASALDIPILYVYLPFQFRIVFKSELLSYPFVGWHLKRSGQVCINQQNPAVSIGAIKSAVRSLCAGMPLVIFPEGGRTRDGQLQPFLPGAFFLAIKARAEIVPIALVGTFELLPMDTYHIKSQPLEMRVGDPVQTSGLTLHDMEAVSSKVKSSIESLIAGTPVV
jgi:1-acyl-sn-glycerol-3-phosphate acyltransferase